MAHQSFSSKNSVKQYSNVLVTDRLMQFGTYQTVVAQMHIDLRLVDVETGKVINPAEKTISAGSISPDGLRVIK